MIRFIWILLLCGFSMLFAEGKSKGLATSQTQVEQDTLISDSPEESRAESDSETIKSPWFETLTWPFAHIVQPIFNAAVFPFSAPLHYAVKNNVIETGVNMFSFGKEKNIFIYPTMNLRPGASTLLGFMYRHRNLLLSSDYFVFGSDYYANGDWSLTTRYTKRNVFNSEFFWGAILRYSADRNAVAILPGGKESFTYADSSYSLETRIGRPMPFVKNMDFELNAKFSMFQGDVPDVEDSVAPPIIYDDYNEFNRYDRGLYQDYFSIPLRVSVSYDDLNAPFMPTTGSRIVLAWTYSWVGNYKGNNTYDGVSNRYNHDFQVIDFVAQHYFFMGTTSTNYGLSSAEGRKSRKFYTDFSWDEALRLWRPENVKSTLFNRRVIAVQLRARQMWEQEEGGAPFTAFSSVNARYPLRGYLSSYADFATLGLSAEYRWPIDRLVDGVVFNEYAFYGRTWHSFAMENLLNSWGFGVRVRRPDMYLFRLQLGFHGLHGVSFVCTVAPEFQ